MNKKTGIAVIVLGQFAIGSAALFARAGLDAGMKPTSLAAWRLTIGAMLVLAYALAVKRSRPAALPSHPWRLVVAGAVLGVHFSTWFESLNHISIAVSTLLVATCPIWAGLLEIVLWRKPPKKAFWLGLGLALIGLALVSLNTASKASGSVALGCFWAISGAVAFAVYLLIAQPYQRIIGTARTVSWTYASAAASMWVVAFAVDWPTVSPTNAMGWTSVVGMAILAQGVGHTTLNWSLKSLSPSIVGVTALLEPVFAAALAWPLFGEPIGAIQAFGAMILMLGVGVVLIKGADNPSGESDG